MNRRPPGLSLSKAFVGFENHKAAEGLSPRTLVSYMQHLKLFLEYAGDVNVGQVTKQNLRAFLAWLRTEYKPHLMGRVAKAPTRIPERYLERGH